MTTSELAAVEALLLKVLPDPMGFAERVFGELAERLATNPSSNGPNVVSGYESTAHDALVDRNMLLAAALGACECWSEDVECPSCGGEGSAGWVPPDPELYAEYVAPAVRRTSSDGPPSEANATQPLVPDRRIHPAGTAGTSLTDDRPGEGEAR
jgi:hypothetical protein